MFSSIFDGLARLERTERIFILNFAVYNMPIWLRNFTFQKLQEHYEKEKAEYDKINKKTRKKKKKEK